MHRRRRRRRWRRRRRKRRKRKRKRRTRKRKKRRRNSKTYSTGNSNKSNADVSGSNDISIDNSSIEMRMWTLLLMGECGRTHSEVPTCSTTIRHISHMHADIPEGRWTAYTEVRHLQQVDGGEAVLDEETVS